MRLIPFRTAALALLVLSALLVWVLVTRL